MPPIKLTLESFEDVAGYPGKIFYVLHEYPGTGCPQVPYLAIDKTEDGGFKIRDLNPSPRKEFKDAQYKYDRPRDPRLQWACDEYEEVAPSEIPPPANAKASSMPVIQEVKSIDLDFFQKNKHTQGLMVSKDGCSIEQNGAHTSPVVKPESSSRVLMGISVQDSSVTNSDDASTSRSLPVIIAGGSGVKTEEFMSTNIGNEVRQIEQKVRTWDSSPQDTASLGAVSGSGTSESGGTMVDVSKQIKSLDQQSSSTSRNILAVGGEGCVASQKARSAELMDSVSKHTDTVGQNSVDKSSVLLKESSVQDKAVNLKGSPSVTQKTGSAELKAKLDKVETLATTLPHSSTGSSLLKESSVQGKAIPNSTVIQNASTSRTELIGKKLDNVLEEDPKVCGSHNSSPVFGAASKKIKVERSRARSVDAEVDDAPSNILASLPVPVDNSKGHKEVGIAESEYPGKSCIDDSPILSVAKTVHESHSSSGKSTLALNKPCVKQKRKSNAVTCSDTPVESTINEASFDSVASVAETDEEEVTPRYAVIKEISGIISDILTEHVKSSNHTSTAPTVTDLGMSKIDTKSEPQKIPKRDCPSTVRFDEKGTPDNTSHVDVVNELSSMVTGIISSCSKSSNSANSDLKKFRELKDQTDMDKSNLKKSREAPFLPKVQRELSEVDRIINKARNFVKQKRIEFLEFEDQPAMKPSRGSSVGGRSKEVEAKDKYQKQKSETILKKSVTSASKAGCSGDIISKEPDSAQGSGKRSSSSFKPNSAGSSSCVELKDSACDSSSVGFAGTPVDVYELPEGDGEPACKPASKVSQRRNTVDGSENGRGVQIKRCSSKYLPYNLQKYRKELDKHRPTKKHPNIVKAQKSVESPSNDEKSAAQSRSCPGSPVSNSLKSTIEDIFNLQAILTDESSVCNYSDITLKGPVQVASNAPQESKPIKKPTSDNVMESSKNSVTNSEGSLSSYAEPCVSKTPKRSESKMKERQTKMLQLLQKKKLTPETHAVVDKSDSGTITKPRSPEVGGSSQKLQNVGMHKLPAMVSCRTQVKPLPKKAVKKDNSNSRLKVGSLTKGGDKNKNLEKEVQAKDAGKISKIDPQVKSVSENLRNVVTDKMDLSPLTEIRKLQFALKRQKKLESSPSSSPLRKSEQIKVTEVALPGDENAATSSLKTTSVNDKSSTILSLGDVPSDCTLYSDLTPAAKLLKNDVKKCLDPPKTLDPNLTPKRLTDRKNEKTDIKNKTEYDKVPKKGSVSPLINEEESLIKNSSIVDLSRQGSPIVKIAPVESSVVTASREKPASSTSADTSPTIANDLDKGRQHSPKAEASPVVAKEASLLELRPSAVTPPTAFSGDGCATAESRETVVSSHVLANISSTRVMSPHESRTTESRKQILHQLTSKLPEINALSPFDGSAYKADAHEERLGLEDIGSHDFIEDRIKNVVNDIVKVNIGNEKMKNCGTLDPPTAEELGELYSEIFDDDISQTERDETATKLLADESNVAANLSAAPVSVVANAKVGQKVDDLPEGINEGIEQETESYQTATDTPVEQSDVNTVTPTVVPEKNASDLQEIPVNQSTTTDQMASSEMNVNCEESPAPSSCESTAAASVLTENNGTGENQKETQLSQISSGSRCFPGSPSNDDVVEISSQDSSPEIVDVDAVGPSSQTSKVTSSRRVKRRRRVFKFERVPTLVTLSRDRMVRGNKLAVLRKLMAQRFSVEPFSWSGKIPSISRPKRDRKRKPVSKAVNLEEPIEAVVLSRELVKCENEDGKTKIVKAVVDNVVETAKPEFSKPTVVGPSKPVVETAKYGVTQSKVKSGKSDIAKPAKPEVINPVVTAAVLEVAKSTVAAAESDFIDADVHSVEPEVTKSTGGTAKPEVTKASANAAKPEVAKVAIDYARQKVAQPPVNQPWDVMEIDEDQMSESSNVAVPRGESISLVDDERYPLKAHSGEESIPFLEDEEYPPKSAHHLNSVAMPKPIVTLSSEPMDEDVVITGVTTITGKSLLTVASSSISESSRSSSKRSPTGESSPQKRKRMCFIPAPMLLPVNTSIPSNIKSRLGFRSRYGYGIARYCSRFKRYSSTFPTVEPVMPLPMLEFRDSPTRRSGSPASHAPPKLTVQDNVPETPGTSSAEPLSSPAPPILTDEQAPPTLEPILPEPSSECQESPSPTTASLTPPTLSEQEKDSDTSEATSTEPSSSAQKRMSTLSGKLHGTSSSPARNDHGMKTDPGPSAKSIATRKVLHKEKSRAGHFLPGGWRWQAKLNQVSQRRGGWHRYPPKSDQSSEGTERNPSTECKTSQEDVRIHCTAQDKLEVERNSRRDCCEAESRSTPPELSPVHRDHMKERSCSQPPDLSPIRSVGTEGSPTPTEPPESTPGQRETQRRPCKRIILTTPLTREGSGQESTAPNQDSTTVTCGRHQRDPPRIIKAGREEAAWRNQTEGGRRFLGRRLRNFFQPVATPGSSKSFSGKWTDRGGSSRASGPSQQAAVAASPSTKKLRSSAGHSGGKSDVRHRDGGVQKGRPWKADGPHQDGAQKGRSWKSDSPRQDGGAQEPWKTDDRRQDGGARKDRSSPQKRRAGPGQGKGDKRKTEGGRSHPVLRSTAHKTRSGLIRKGDS